MKHSHGIAALAAAGLALSAPGSAEVRSGVRGGAPAGCLGLASAAWLNVAAEQVRGSDGVIVLTLYPDDKARFLKPMGSHYVVKVPARAGTTPACVFVPKPGVYALALYHDANANGKLDRNAIGIPKEGFGFSGNPKIQFSAPSLESVRLTVGAAGMQTRIRMRYP